MSGILNTQFVLSVAIGGLRQQASYITQLIWVDFGALLLWQLHVVFDKLVSVGCFRGFLFSKIVFMIKLRATQNVDFKNYPFHS